MRKLFILAALAATSASAVTIHRSFSGGYPSAPSSKKIVPATAAEKLYAAIPRETLDKVTGFFAPVVKKYMPAIKRFQKEYALSTDKMGTIAKYVPTIEAALREARKMRVPAKYEEEKASYLRMAQGFVTTLKLIVPARSAKPLAGGEKTVDDKGDGSVTSHVGGRSVSVKGKIESHH